MIETTWELLWAPDVLPALAFFAAAGAIWGAAIWQVWWKSEE